VIAATRLAREAGLTRVVTADMGGTSFDVAVSVDGEPAETRQTSLDFRIPVRVPMVDVRTIGAGGGSIAWIDRGGILQVGPRSAGSRPGPVAFGRGGAEPTVTDANVVLGRINADAPIGAGGERLDVDGARAALARVGAELGFDAEETARAILSVVDTRMAGQIRLLTIDRGHDPRDFTLVIFGGAGPLHGAALVREAGLAGMLVPRFPGVLCALGCAAADLRYDFSQTLELVLDEGAELGRLRATLDAQRAEGERCIARDGVGIDELRVHHVAEMAYAGQVHRIRVPVERSWHMAQIVDAFAATYEREYGVTLPGLAVTLVNATTTVVGVRTPPPSPRPALEREAPAPVAVRRVCFDEWLETPIYRRADLGAGCRLEGPAVIEQADTTTLVQPGSAVRVDELLNLRVEAS
jgi:N-methylhydantoinase A